MQAVFSSAMPFAGLGFDLAPVRVEALRMTVHRGGPPQRPERYAPAAPAPGRWGYGLLLSLSREIRGR
jgi:hypothetical protein